MFTTRSFGAICLIALFTAVGCSDDSAPTTAPTPVPDDGGGDGGGGGPQLRSFTVDLANIDDTAIVKLNGTELPLSNPVDPNPILLDPMLVSGNNTFEVRLYNNGCFASSLDLTIFENNAIGEPTRTFSRGVSDCGLQLVWIYHLNRETGITRVQ